MGGCPGLRLIGAMYGCYLASVPIPKFTPLRRPRIRTSISKVYEQFYDSSAPCGTRSLQLIVRQDACELGLGGQMVAMTMSAATICCEKTPRRKVRHPKGGRALEQPAFTPRSRDMLSRVIW